MKKNKIKLIPNAFYEKSMRLLFFDAFSNFCIFNSFACYSFNLIWKTNWN